MKTLVKMMVLVTMVTAFTATSTREARAQSIGVQVSFQLFYDQLSPYGYWVTDPNYGYVWVPDVGPDFFPYATNGYWVCTHFGWTWVSDYSWGWGPFHYGRWYYDPFYGYVWIPGTEWGPAWVVWRNGYGYYGWAPLGPNISIQMAFAPTYIIPHDHWIFIRERDFGRRDPYRYYVDRSTNVNIYNNTTVIQNTYVDASRNTTYISGPDRGQVEKVTGKKIQPVAIRDTDQPRQQMASNELQIYRPKVSKSDSRNPRPAPSESVKSGERKGRVEKKSPAATKSTTTSPSKQAQPERGTKQAQPEKGTKQVQPERGTKQVQPERGTKQVQPERGTKQAQPGEKMMKPKQEKSAAPSRKVEAPNEKKSTPPVRQMKQPEKNAPATREQKATPQEEKKSVSPARQNEPPAQQKDVRQAPDQQKDVKNAPSKQTQTKQSGKQTQKRRTAPSPDDRTKSQRSKGRGK